MKKNIILLFLIFFASGGYAIDLDSLENVKKPEVKKLPRFAAGLKFAIGGAEEVSTSFELDGEWYPLRYIGLGFGIEHDTTHGLETVLDIATNMNDNYEEYDEYDEDRIDRFNFHPYLAFRTPLLYFPNGSDWGIMLQCKPGLCMSVPSNEAKWVEHSYHYRGGQQGEGQNVYNPTAEHWVNRNGAWLTWRVMSSVSIGRSMGALSIGWTVSNYNILSSRNNMYCGGRRVGNHTNLSCTNMLFISISGFF